LSRKLADLTRKIETTQGKWKLTPHHELILRRRGKAKQAEVPGSLVAAEPEALVISVTVKEDEKRYVTGLVKLKGRWKLDSKNRMTFLVKRPTGKYDKLTFQGAWKVNLNHEVVYQYETQRVLRGRGKKRRLETRSLQELVFKGHWEITKKNRLTYQLGGDSASAFHFRGTFQTTSMVAKKGEIRYQYGIEIEKKVRTKTLILFGKWKFSRKLGLHLDVEYKNGQKHSITFGGDYHLSKDKKIEVNLKGKKGQKLGVELVFTKDFLQKDGQAFIRLMKSTDESRIEGGLRFRW